MEETSFAAVAGTGVDGAVGDVPEVTFARSVGIPAHPAPKRRKRMKAMTRHDMLDGKTAFGGMSL